MQKDLAQSSKLLLETKLSDFRLGEADGFKVYRDMIATPGDGIIIFKGMNDYTADSIKSLEGFKRGWWEEAQGATPRACRCIARPCALRLADVVELQPAPQDRSGRCDVPRRGDTDRGRGGRANWRDNPWFTAELEQERLDCLRMQPDQYSTSGKAITSRLPRALITRRPDRGQGRGRIGEVAADPLMEYRCFWDIGTRDATAIWVAQFVGSRDPGAGLLRGGRTAAWPTHLNWLREGLLGGFAISRMTGNADHLTADKFEDHIAPPASGRRW
jgi:phage terminase large subunit